MLKNKDNKISQGRGSIMYNILPYLYIIKIA